MTAQTLYNRLVQGTISENKFLYEVRRDPSLTMITKFNSLKDTIQILKSRSIISENKDLTPKFKADKTPEVPKVVSLTIDQVSPHEYSKGINYELDLNYKSVGQNMPKDDELKKAQIKVLKNLATDPYYYTRKCMSDEEKKLEKANLRPEELGKDMTAKNQTTKGKILKEGVDDLGDGYTHFAIMKSNNKIADGWDYSELYDEDTRSYDNASIKEYTKLDLTDNFPENKPSDFKILNRKSVEKMGLNPQDTNNWYKPQNISEELDADTMPEGQLRVLGQIIEEWGLVESDMEDPEVMEELTDEFQKRWGIEEAVAVKDRAGNIQYAKDDSEAADLVNNARTKGVQLTKQSV